MISPRSIWAFPAGAKRASVDPPSSSLPPAVLRGEPNVVQVVPLTRTIRSSGAEVFIEPDGENHLLVPSAAQCQHVRSVSVTRLSATRGTVGAAVLAEIREVLGLLLDL